MIRGTLLMLVGFYETLRISVPTLIDKARGRRSETAIDARLAGWAERLVGHASVRLTVSGQENIRPGEVYIVMSNHESMFDIPLLFHALPLKLRMVAKKELFRIPIFGPALRESSFVEIDRSNLDRAKASLEVAKDRLGAGISVWISPEGTRSRTGELLPFKKGGFHLAAQTGISILPVGMAGTADLVAPDSPDVKANTPVHISIFPPITAPPSDADSAALDALTLTTRAVIERAIVDARSRRPRE